MAFKVYEEDGPFYFNDGWGEMEYSTAWKIKCDDFIVEINEELESAWFTSEDEALSHVESLKQKYC